MSEPIAGPEVEAVVNVVMIPTEALPAASARLHPFRVLLQSPLGRIAWFDLHAKAPPSSQALAAIGSRIDALHFESERIMHSELARLEYDCAIKFIDGDFLDTNAWPVDRWIQMQTLHIASQISQMDDLLRHRQDIVEQSRAYLQQRLAQFRQRMQAEAARAFSLSDRLPVHAWNYVHHPNPVLRRNRAQALSAYPFLAAHICVDDFAPVREAIDAGALLEKALSRHFGVKAAVIRRMGHQSLGGLQGPFAHPCLLMSFMDTVPLTAIPATDNDWRRFMVLSDRVAEFIDQPVTTPLGQAILAECLSKNEAMRLALSDEWHQHQNALRHLLHALVSIAGFLLQGKFSPKEANLKSRASVGKFVSVLGLRRLLRFSSQWSAAYRMAVSIDAGRQDAIRRYRWPTLVSGPVQIGMITATPLADIASLTVEGARMSNCVASYAADCRSGICQIWSLQSQDKALSATLQTFVDSVHANTRPVIRLGQLEGPKGSKADPALADAAARLVDGLSAQSEKLWDYMVEVDRYGVTASSGQIDSFTAQSLAHALRTIFEGKVVISDLYERILSPHFSPERFRILFPAIEQGG